MKNSVTRIIGQYGHDDRALIHNLQLLHEDHGDGVFREALKELVGKEFKDNVARRYWEEALAHRQKILVGEKVDSALRPALLDYLHQVVGEIADPRIVEAVDLADIRNASICDGLTGLYNQTYFKSFLEKVCNQRFATEDPATAILLLDLDHFKQLNDRCGHLAGDRALKQVAKIISHCIRKGDVAARYGGEEFAVLLSNVSRDQAYSVADRIRKVIEKASFQGEHLLDRGTLTISGGLSFILSKHESAENLIQKADEELYRAKLFRNVISPHQSESRKAARMQKQSIVEFSLADESTFAPAISFDVSPFGIALDCDRKIEIGSAVRLRFRHPFWPSNRQVLASIRYIDEQKGTGLFRLGLQFSPEQALNRSDGLLQNIA